MPAGYSGTPLAKKLGVKPGHRLALIDAAENFEGELAGLPDDVKPARGFRGTAPIDVVLIFATKLATLDAHLAKARRRIPPNGMIWLCWPKQAAVKKLGIDTDLSDGAVRELGLAHKLVDNKTCAVDEVWSGLRFVIRIKDR